MPFDAAAFKQQARELQIDGIGIVPVSELSPPARSTYLAYLAQNRQAGMAYLERNIEKRLAPKQLMPEAESIVAILCGYRQSAQYPVNPRISLYAQGADYHSFVKEKLFRLARMLEPAHCRCFCDTAPVAEKYWAKEAGLGHIGKNTLLIHPELGSYCFIGILMTEARFDRYDPPLENAGTPTCPPHPCLQCDLCRKACPGNALQNGLDARKCFSYLTIENKGERPPIPTSYWYGCDICQTVCPANSRIVLPDHEAFRSTESILSLTEKTILNMSPAVFREQFRDSAIERAGLDGLKKNVAAWIRGRNASPDRKEAPNAT